ncbi:HesA/MoeB/ThiF family protein [Variovorax ginsengisoli]|uniref:Molybdopterin/thiamine biosynthesis adenylyltransferase n=1 Tax=Variovorax ginsengisoli TaxID=363844 RepID=A0ABT9S633_9BURK|nr:molybdopterin-synthase adenylyltransferase MoeB [Variovorax ginsengisoli]MDP9899820.1 molybdopterin/thiamine biosynthesis adenylyltransferase [Variovorax ginsengisoli]
MEDLELLRYSRHILLEEFGIDGQERVSRAHALVIGAGGLGSPVALYLAAAGVGRITLVDDDEVDLTNLQRQVAHSTARVGLPKVDSAAQAMRALNPTIDVVTHAQRADAALLDQLLPGTDVVVDCCDNFATRHIVNHACVVHGKPLVAGAALRFDGQLSVYDTRDATSPCYACIFPPQADFEETRCAVMGVFAPVVGTIGTLQASEALKLLAGISPSLAGSLLMFDGRRTAFDTLRIARDPQCGVCATRKPVATSITSTD